MGFIETGLSYLFFAIIHFFQFILAVTVCGLYGVDISRARQQGKYLDSKWVYAEVVGGISALSALLLMIPFFLRFALSWAWNLVLFILWIALFGTFGAMYIKEDPEGNGDIMRMKNAVWVDLASALLWFISALAGFAYWSKHKERKSRFTGRAKV